MGEKHQYRPIIFTFVATKNGTDGTNIEDLYCVSDFEPYEASAGEVAVGRINLPPGDFCNDMALFGLIGSCIRNRNETDFAMAVEQLLSRAFATGVRWGQGSVLFGKIKKV